MTGEEPRRRPPPHSASRAFLDEQEERHENGQRDIVNGHADSAPRGYDRSGKPVLEIAKPGLWGPLPVPRRDWMIEGWLLRGTVALVTGDGGMGKSLLMQQLATACATGNEWLGMPVQPARSLCLFAEDSRDELHIRQEYINRHYGIDYSDLDGVQFLPRPGHDNVLEVFDRNTDRGTKTPLWHEVRGAALAHKAQLIVLDTAADVYGGNENYRTQVRNFIASLRGLAIELNGAVILTAHPSVAGMATGSGISGSTAWHNSVRARAFLSRPMTADGNQDYEDPARVLKFPKNNSGPASGAKSLEWADGVFRATGTVTGGVRSLDAVDIIELHVAMQERLRAWVEQGSQVASSTDFPGGFVNRLSKMAEFKGYTRSQLINAQEALIARKKIARVEIGPASRRRKYLRMADQTLPGEPPILPGLQLPEKPAT